MLATQAACRAVARADDSVGSKSPINSATTARTTSNSTKENAQRMALTPADRKTAPNTS
ncbi:MAG: hypothetical protein AAFY08_04465 [Planctomycetota bacterium]